MIGGISIRERLPDRRPSITFMFELHGLRYVCSYSVFDDGRVAEVFISSHKPGSMADMVARDGAIAASLALQHGCPLAVLCRALPPMTPLGLALHAIEGAHRG